MCTLRDLTAVPVFAFVLGSAPLALSSQEEVKKQANESSAFGKEEKRTFALEAKEGDQLTYLVTPWRHGRAGGRDSSRSPGEDARQPRDGKSRDYRLTVREVSSTGDITMLVAMHRDDPRARLSGDTGSGGEEPSTNPRSEVRDDADAKSRSSVTTIMVGSDGCVKHAYGRAVSESSELETHLRFILGSGLHGQKLEAGKVYPLASLYKGAAARHALSDASSAISMRFEGMERKQGDHGVARFTILAPDQARPAEGRGSTEIRPETSGSKGSGETRKALDERPWKSLGEAGYRIEDGFLERLSLIGDPASLHRPDESLKWKTMSILRIHSAP